MTEKRIFVVFAVLVVLSCGVYLLVSANRFGPGFPLDDAWIHQTYARNLAEHGEWAFFPGQPSAGITAPLWVLLLVPGVWAGLTPTLSANLWGGGILLATAFVGMFYARQLFPAERLRPFLVGALLVFEWHLVWAALSGMETLLFALIVLTALSSLFVLTEEAPLTWWLFAGLLVGLTAWVRPEGVTLLGPLGLYALTAKTWKDRVTRGIVLLVGTGLLFGPYLAFNRWLAGSWWPNTFYAKQAEYAILRESPLLNRLLQQFSLPLVGVGLVLLPGFGYLLWSAWQERRWPVLLNMAWMAGHFSLYALRLPVVYQHGRYAIPAMPIYFIWGAVGLLRWAQPRAKNTLRRVASLSWVSIAVLLLLGFWVLGAQSYADDVGIIETEMVATARWVDENIPSEALIAAHDIGALGYFAERPLLDLAGLVSPDVIPFIRDEAQLAQYVDQQQAAYLITFPDWYPEMVHGLEPVYRSSGTVSPSSGGENMVVFRWPVGE